MIRITKHISIDRNEIAGAFGDIGTDLPLLAGMILVSDLDGASVFIIYGLLQIISGCVYGIPMAVQPLKAVATLVIAQKLTSGVIFGGGLAIGAVMLLLTLSGGLQKIASVIPREVVRGVQVGLGITLAIMALKEYIIRPGDPVGYFLAFAAFVMGLFLLGNRRYPAALFVILLGVCYAFITDPGLGVCIVEGSSFDLPEMNGVTGSAVLNGFLLLAIPQIPLSIGNSILASKQVAEDLFPEKKISVRKIGLTYSLMNLIVPFFGGVPVCHGSGGMLGHYTFGARTGGSVVVYGTLYLIIGCFFSSRFSEVMQLFPVQILGVILLFEAISLIALIKDVAGEKDRLYSALLVAILCVTLPYGFFLGMLAGLALKYCTGRIKLFKS